MGKKIEVIELSQYSEDIFNDVAYSLDIPGVEELSDSDIINHMLEEVKAFEDIMQESITEWLQDNKTEQYQLWLEKWKKSLSTEK